MKPLLPRGGSHMIGAFVSSFFDMRVGLFILGVLEETKLRGNKEE